jgi:hypothetical protein
MTAEEKEEERKEEENCRDNDCVSSLMARQPTKWLKPEELSSQWRDMAFADNK